MAKTSILAGGKTPAGQNPAYMGPDKGPFKCKNCEYYEGLGKCTKTEMIDQQGKNPAKVDPNGCCNYYERTNGVGI